MIETEKHRNGLFFIKMLDKINKNALNEFFIEELNQIIIKINQAEDIKVVIIMGLKDYFSIGGSFQFVSGLEEFYKKNISHSYLSSFKGMLNVSVPIIAAMEGSAIGGGLTLALYSDIIVAAEESRYGFSFMNMGFTPGMGTTALAKEAFGYFNSFEMLCCGAYKKGRELKGKSNFNYILPKNEVLHKAIEIAECMAEKPLVSLKLLKHYLSLRRRQALEEAITVEAFMHNISFNQTEIQSFIKENYWGS